MRYRIGHLSAIVMALVFSSFPAFAGDCESNGDSAFLEGDAVREMPSGLASRGLDVADDLATVKHQGVDADGGLVGTGADARLLSSLRSRAGKSYTWSDGFLWSGGCLWSDGPVCQSRTSGSPDSTSGDRRQVYCKAG